MSLAIVLDRSEKRILKEVLNTIHAEKNGATKVSTLVWLI